MDAGYFGWNIARGLALSPSGTGYMLDGWGALHAVKIRGDGFPTGPAFNATVTGLRLLAGLGHRPRRRGAARRHRRLRARRLGRPPPVRLGNGPAPPAAGRRTYWPGWDIARDVALLPDGTGGYVLDGWGGLHPFGDRQPPGAAHGHRPVTGRLGHRPRRRVLPDGTGGYVLDGYGGLHPFAIGNHPLPPAASAGYWRGWDIARGTTLVP